MPILNRGFRSRRQPGDDRLPPGQHLADGFPVLTAGPTPRVPTDTWRFVITDAARRRHTWSWDELMRLPREQITADIHCVTKWSKLGTRWEGVSLDTLFESVPAVADHALVHTYDAYTTNVPLGDLLGAKAWLAYRYEGAELDPRHGGPARLLVPHLYLWKSAKWVRGMHLLDHDEPGFWEMRGYHNYGDPWREQRYAGD
ncbi:sulfite oxidase-like oxidoreductase [Actinocatenispora comari]|uniref:Molybdopterin-binding protein n=1 Tax=Actinocatenispora comari TaxID=2807577 RepID=A0A8J4ENL1_9ACTN|nr:sulfite oxidase-like oxidoreductase [Actinocatenispora comari]GIL27789.1 molybdopterin-binding protein [Actinocatenispora comari]